MYFLRLFLLCCSTLALPLAAQQTASPKTLADWDIRPILGMQGWGTYTAGFEDYDSGLERYVPVDNRVNFMIRRLRFGSVAKVGDRVLLKFLGAGDFVGADQRSATIGGVNNGGFPNLQIWDLFLQYRISRESEALYAIGGYLRPPIGRESMSGAFGVSSFEKGFNQWYVRQHLVGTGPGGVGGAYLGGLRQLADNVHVDYRGGVFNAQNAGISEGRMTSPLLAGRINFMFGDPEKSTWSYGLPAANSFGKRKTVALALNVAHEGPTATATGGIDLLGVDFVVDRGHFHVEGEYHAMNRRVADDALPELFSATYMLRAGFNIQVPPARGSTAPRYLEPTVMVYGFDGTTDPAEYQTVLATDYFGGTERVVDFGLNYHLRPGKVRLGLHYTAFTGDLGALPPDGRHNWTFRQAGIGGIRRGGYGGFEVIVNY